MPRTIPLNIHAEISPEHVTPSGALRVSEKGTVEVLVPDAVIEADVLPEHHHLAKDAGYRRILLRVDRLGRDSRSLEKVLQIPYAGWRVYDAPDEASAAVVDDRGRTVVTYHQHDPLTDRSPKTQAEAYLTNLRRDSR